MTRFAREHYMYTSNMPSVDVPIVFYKFVDKQKHIEMMTYLYYSSIGTSSIISKWAYYEEYLVSYVHSVHDTYFSKYDFESKSI